MESKDTEKHHDVVLEYKRTHDPMSVFEPSLIQEKKWKKFSEDLNQKIKSINKSIRVFVEEINSDKE